MSEQPDRYVKRYGQIAIEKGFITKDQLIEALTIQVTEEISGEGHRLTGVILIDLGYITLSQDLEVLNELGKN
jgi:hypothetical protein